MDKELQKRFEKHSPLVIYPFGKTSGGELQGRVIGEGFQFDGGIFFFDYGWNNPGAGTGSDHFIFGKIKGPLKDSGGALYWKVGDTRIQDLKEGSPLYGQAVDNQKRAVKFSKDKWKSRKRAEELFQRFLEEK